MDTKQKEAITFLSDLKLFQKAIVKKISSDNKPLRRRFLDMGLTRGVEVFVKKIAPMGDPIDIEIRGYELCLRKKDVRQIEVEVL